MAEPDAHWSRLSQSSKRALLFASAAVRARKADESAPPEVECADLLVGLVLAHPGKSEAKQFFSHFGLVPGQALPEIYPQLTAEVLNRSLAEWDPTQQPPLSAMVESIVDRAVQTGLKSGSSEVAEVRNLWAHFLDQAPEMRDLLLTHRIPPNVVSATIDWVLRDGGMDYADVLKDFQPSPVQVVNYKADSYGDRLHGDLLDISVQVDAFAYLLASHTLRPPLAVGLFGEWGAGKSFFMDAMRSRIASLTREVRHRPQRTIPFWKRIAQVRFNAWHYVEGDLWSSLANDVLSQLEIATDDRESGIVGRRQQYLLNQIQARKDDLRKLTAHRTQLDRQLEERQAELRRTEIERDHAFRELQTIQGEQLLNATLREGGESIVKAIEAVGIQAPEGKLTFGQASEALREARYQVVRGGQLLRPLLEDWKTLTIGLTALALTPLIVWGVDEAAGSPAFAASSGISSVGLVLIGISRRLTSWVRERLDKIDDAKRTLEKELANERQAWDRRVDDARTRWANAAKGVESAVDQEKDLRDKLRAVEDELAKKPSEVLNEFLRERVKAGEYRDRLGVPSLIRRDFQALAELIEDQNIWLLADDSERARLSEMTEFYNPPNEEDDSKIINRIILYIDDLDRCPDGKVIEVLQAVHLLLAFPLFVVVVAVDPRWLANSLHSRYPALGGSGINRGSAQPEDYLEKIFQIPFWVRPIEDEGRAKIVHGLLEDHLERNGGESIPDGGSALAWMGEPEAHALSESLDRRTAPPRLRAAALTVSNEEMRFFDQLVPLMGSTPRSVKRLVNVYQLVKILRSGEPIRPISSPSDDNLVLFILCLAEGLPNLARNLWELAHRDGNSTLGQFLDGTDPAEFGDQLERLRAWILAHPEWSALNLHRIGELLPDVGQFLFTPAA